MLRALLAGGKEGEPLPCLGESGIQCAGSFLSSLSLLCSEARVLGARCLVWVSVNSPDAPGDLSLPPEMLTRTYASAGVQAVFGTLNEEGLKEMLAKKNLAGLVVFIGRLMEELCVRHPEEKFVREVAERAHAT